MHRTGTTIFVLLGILFVVGCDEPFDPKGTFEPRLSIVLILRATDDAQHLRLHATYDPPGFNPLEFDHEPNVSGAVVSMSGPSGAIAFRDSLIPHPDTARFGGTLTVFTAAPFQPVRGGQYDLTVALSGYPTAHAITTVPEPMNVLLITNTGVLSNPRVYDTQDINLILRAPPQAKGYYPRFFVEYELLLTPTRIETAEIPFTLVQTSNEVTPRYPTLTPLDMSPDLPFSVTTTYTFQTEAYRYYLDQIVSTYGQAVVRFRRAFFHLYLVDQALYDYYNVANGFRDEFSVRTDVPDVTNITDGVGVFGSMTLDSLSYALPQSIQY